MTKCATCRRKAIVEETVVNSNGTKEFNSCIECSYIINPGYSPNWKISNVLVPSNELMAELL